MGLVAHDVQAHLVNLYIDRQICEMDRLEAEGSPLRRTDGSWVYPTEDEILTLPRVRCAFCFRSSVTLLP